MTGNRIVQGIEKETYLNTVIKNTSDQFRVLKIHRSFPEEKKYHITVNKKRKEMIAVEF